MSFAAVEEIARALLYEGYLLYPYRLSALKNRQRWMFGRVLPRAYSLAGGESEPWRMQTECLVLGAPRTELEVSVRFLQLLDCQPMPGERSASETAQREVAARMTLKEIHDRPARIAFAWQPHIDGAVTVSAAVAAPQAFKLTVAIENLTPVPDDIDLDRVLFRSLLSAHTLLAVREGSFVSLLDPPAAYRALASSCRNIGSWPVLAGPEGGKVMLSAPIILYDYPQVAAESSGDLFDGTEIEELLRLRIGTLTDAEKREMSAGEQGRAVLERTEALTGEQLLQLHGRLTMGGSLPRSWQPGDRVRLRPRQGADALDIMLSGQQATVVAVERDLENQVYLGVVVDDDPGRDFGLRGLPGHRFYYRVDEVEPL